MATREELVEEARLILGWLNNNPTERALILWMARHPAERHLHPIDFERAQEFLAHAVLTFCERCFEAVVVYPDETTLTWPSLDKHPCYHSLPKPSGPVAQPAERRPRKAEVAGSKPVRPSNPTPSRETRKLLV